MKVLLAVGTAGSGEALVCQGVRPKENVNVVSWVMVVAVAVASVTVAMWVRVAVLRGACIPK